MLLAFLNFKKSTGYCEAFETGLVFSHELVQHQMSWALHVTII